ncbi:MAG TPA: hypothetical protein DDW85_13140 [Porphyromonadaceae bacterium]|nr:hypothetical protein [Porphyromonadaceae bacterium]
MKIKEFFFLLSIALGSILLAQCSSSKTIVEDFHTETYNTRMAYFGEHPLQKGQIVFFGNSITQAGEWESYFPGSDVLNRGISGDNTEGMLARIDEIVQSQPAKFFIMAGINDISLARDEKTIVDNYRQIIQAVKNDSPQTEIYIQSVLPVNNDFARYSRLKGKEERILSLNRKLKALADAENIPFINLFSYFADASGKLIASYTGDGLHLTPEAYALWTNIIRSKVVQETK